MRQYARAWVPASHHFKNLGFHTLGGYSVGCTRVQLYKQSPEHPPQRMNDLEGTRQEEVWDGGEGELQLLQLLRVILRLHGFGRGWEGNDRPPTE